MSGVVENVGIEFGFATPSLAVQRLQLCWPPSIHSIRYLPTSGQVDGVISKSDENVEVEVRIASPSLTVQRLFPFHVFRQLY